MRDWFAQTFGQAVADMRAKLIDEAWFGRRVPEPHGPNDLGWSRDDDPSPERETRSQEPDQEHGIDR